MPLLDWRRVDNRKFSVLKPGESVIVLIFAYLCGLINLIKLPDRRSVLFLSSFSLSLKECHVFIVGATLNLVFI